MFSSKENNPFIAPVKYCKQFICTNVQTHFLLWLPSNKSFEMMNLITVLLYLVAATAWVGGAGDVRILLVG